MLTNCTVFWWLHFFKCWEWYLNMFTRPNFQVSIPLSVIGIIVLYTRIFINHFRYIPFKSKGKKSLNQKILVSLLWFLKPLWSLQQFKMILKNVLNLVIVCKKISPRYGSDKIKVSFLIVVTWGRFITNLLITISKHLPINGKRYPFFKNTYFKN